MQSITFTCETITPMFLSGADGQTPELRAPSIKGALRFWWRAMNGHLGLEELKEKEMKIFGGVGNNNVPACRSSVLLKVKVIGALRTIDYDMLPHRRDEKQYGNPSSAKAIDTGQKFEITITTLKENEFSIKQASALFQLVVLLGGLGRRVRRGMGSFKIIKSSEGTYKQPESLNDINELLNLISPHFAVQNNSISNTFSGRMEKYGWIKLGITRVKEYRKVLTKTGKIASDLKKSNATNYEMSLGHATRGRFASPVYVSVMENGNGYLPIITTLNTISHKGADKIISSLQEQFKDSL